MESFQIFCQAWILSVNCLSSADELKMSAPFADEQNFMNAREQHQHDEASFDTKHPTLLAVK